MFIFTENIKENITCHNHFFIYKNFKANYSFSSCIKLHGQNNERKQTVMNEINPTSTKTMFYDGIGNR